MTMLKAVVKSALMARQQRRGLPQTLIFFVTSRCNARCDFCLYVDQVDNPVAQERELTAGEVEAIARRYGRLHYLALSGGEPFIRRDLEPLCQAFIDHCGTAVVDIPSNFYYTDIMLATMEPLVRRNPSVIFDLQMSIDHLGGAHDRSRRVNNLYETALKSFRALSALRARFGNLKLKVNVVYLERNRDALEEIASVLDRTIVFDRMQLTYPHRTIPEGRGPDAGEHERVEAFIRAADRLARQTAHTGAADVYTIGMRSVKDLYHRLLRQAVSRERNVGSYCEAGRYIVVINEVGDVFPCEPLWQKVGNLRDSDYDVAAILNGPEYRAFRAARLGADKCNCTWSCAINSSIAVTPSYLPKLAANAAQIAWSRLTGNGS